MKTNKKTRGVFYINIYIFYQLVVSANYFSELVDKPNRSGSSYSMFLK